MADVMPWDAWADAIDDLAAERGKSINVYRSPSEQVAAPAILIRPDSPWQTAADADMPFAQIAERYAAVCLVASTDPLSNQADLRDLVRLARDAAIAATFRWTQTSGISPSEADGVEYLASVVRATWGARD